MKTRLFVLAGATAALLVAAGGVALASNAADDRPAAVTVAAPAAVPAAPTDVLPAVPAAVPAAAPDASPDASAPAVDRAAAERIALDHVGGGRISDGSELEWEHGVRVWEVEVTDGVVEHDLDVDATTGAVIRDRLDD